MPHITKLQSTTKEIPCNNKIVDEQYSSTESLTKKSAFMICEFDSTKFQIYKALFTSPDIEFFDLTDFTKSLTVCFLLRAGRFSGVIFKNENGTVLRSKSIKKYTVRSKQGGSQLSYDNKNGTKKRSVGAQLRRENEVSLFQQIQNLVNDWKEEIKNARLIFYNNSVLANRHDPRLRTYPFTTYKPTTEEIGQGMEDSSSTIQNIFIQFRSLDSNELCSSILSVPASSNKRDLEVLLNELFRNEEFIQYTFSLDGIHVSTSLLDTLKILSKASKTEETLILDYFTEAIFKVRPITRCSSTLSGHVDAILCCAFSPDGRILATGSGDKMVRFWDLQTETPLPLVPSHKDWILCVSWSPDGRFLASGCKDGTIQLWDAPSCKPIGPPFKAHSKWITGLSWEPAHLRYPSDRLCSCSRDGTIKVWNVLRKACEVTLSQHTNAVTAVRWSGKGVIYSTSRDRTMRMWSPDGKQLGTFEGHAHWVNTLALNTDYVLRSGPFDHYGKLRIEEDPKKSAILNFESFKQEEILVTGSDDFTMFLWSPHKSNKPIARLTGHQALVNHVAFSPDGHYIASASFDKSVKLWNGLTGKLINSLRGHVNSVYQITWSADSRLLASCSKDSTVKVWDVSSGKLKQDLPGHLDEVFTVDWSPTGDRAASGGRDKSIKVWRQ